MLSIGHWRQNCCCSRRLCASDVCAVCFVTASTNFLLCCGWIDQGGKAPTTVPGLRTMAMPQLHGQTTSLTMVRAERSDWKCAQDRSKFTFRLCDLTQRHGVAQICASLNANTTASACPNAKCTKARMCKCRNAEMQKSNQIQRSNANWLTCSLELHLVCCVFLRCCGLVGCCSSKFRRVVWVAILNRVHAHRYSSMSVKQL